MSLKATPKVVVGQKAKRRFYWFSKENQRAFLDDLGSKLQVKSLDDWKRVKWQQIRRNGGSSLLNHYHNNLALMLTSVYPEYEWGLSEYKNPKKQWRFQQTTSNDIQPLSISQTSLTKGDWKEDTKKIEEQKQIMDRIFQKLNYTFEEWTKFTLNDFKSEEGGVELLRFYKWNIRLLLSSIYPTRNHLPLYQKKKPNNFWKSLENQRSFLDHLFQQLNLTTKSERSSISWKDIKLHGGASLLVHYNYNISALLKAVYGDELITPHYHHLSHHHTTNNNDDGGSGNDYASIIKLQRPKGFWDDDCNRREAMIALFIRLNIKNFSDVHRRVTTATMTRFGLRSLLRKYGRISSLLTHVFPNYPWSAPHRPTPALRESPSPSLHYSDLSSLSNNRSEDHHYHNNNSTDKRNPTDDVKSSPRTRSTRFYKSSSPPSSSSSSSKSSSSQSSLSLPSSLKEEEKREEEEVEYQRRFVDALFEKKKISLCEWEKLRGSDFVMNGGAEILRFYKWNIRLLLSSLYPSQPIMLYQKKKPNNFWKSLENQRSFLDHLFQQLNLTTKSDWSSISWKDIKLHGGASLLVHYNFNMVEMFRSVYPGVEYDIMDKSKPKGFWKSKENQLAFLSYLFKKFQFRSICDWQSIGCREIQRHGGSGLLKYYHRDLNALFSTLYPSYSWSFHKHKFTPSKLLLLQRKYKVQRKEDWYRLPQHSLFNLLRYLKEVYPDLTWNKYYFRKKLKKAAQRILFVAVQNIFPGFHVFECYKHPQLEWDLTYPMELDIFVPNLNYALEYQGEQHFDDIPSAFSPLVFYRTHDEVKSEFCVKNSILLLPIPFWWDLTDTSLCTTLRNTFMNYISKV